MPFKDNKTRRESWKRWWHTLTPERQQAYRESERIRLRLQYARVRLDPAYRSQKQAYAKTVARFAKFGMTQIDFGYMMERCGGECEGCGREMTHDKNRPTSCHIDHDHGTGAVRGLLCQSCNMILGYAKDSTQVLRRLESYLEEKRPTVPFNP